MSTVARSTLVLAPTPATKRTCMQIVEHDHHTDYDCACQKSLGMPISHDDDEIHKF